jgi:hypothetical protein
MWYIILIAMAGIGFLIGIPFIGKAQTRVSSNPDSSGVMLQKDSLPATWSKEILIEKLQKLAKDPLPVNLEPGAMCYKSAGPPERAEYICPICGERTYYTFDNSRFITRDIPSCRAYAKSITKVQIILDEKQFCKKCSAGKNDNPDLSMDIIMNGEPQPCHSDGVSEEDLQLIDEFLSGKQVHKGYYGEETPLTIYMDRIAKLLCISKEQYVK